MNNMDNAISTEEAAKPGGGGGGGGRYITIAAAQLKPAFLDRQKTTDIVCHWIREAGQRSITLVGFPETFIPGYPAWFSELTVSDPRALHLYKRLLANSLTVPGPETDQISRACRDARVYAVVGVNEKKKKHLSSTTTTTTTGTTWNTMLVFDPRGEIILKHQKYVPTVGERLVHAPGTTGSEASCPTEFGGISTLMCGENSNPLAVYNLAVRSPAVHVASWPSHFGGGGKSSSWSSLLDCSLNASKGLAYTVKCFVINAAAVIGDDAIEAWAFSEQSRDMLEREKGKQGCSTIVNPMGRVIAGPMGGQEEGLLVAEVDLEEIVEAKYTHDFGGHYNRPELFARLFAEYF